MGTTVANTTIASFTTPVTEIQFPTVTICVDQNYDRWAFTRTVLNDLKYACDEFTEEDMDYVDYIDDASLGNEFFAEYDNW